MLSVARRRANDGAREGAGDVPDVGRKRRVLAQDLGLNRARVDAELVQELPDVVRDGDVVVGRLDEHVHRADELGLAERPDCAGSDEMIDAAPSHREALRKSARRQHSVARTVDVDDARHAQDRAANLLERNVRGRGLQQDVAR